MQEVQRKEIEEIKKKQEAQKGKGKKHTICLLDSSESDISVVDNQEDLSESDNSGSESGMDVSTPQPGPSCSHPRR